MPLRFQACLAFLYIIFFCATAGIPSTNTTHQDLKLSALPDRPDKDFRLQLDYDESKPLRDIPLFLACVIAMQELAHLDTDAYVRSTKAWTHPEYPGVVLSLQGKEGRISVRFARWLIHGAMRDMMVLNRYLASHSIGWYRDVEIGQVSFLPGPLASTLQLLASSAPNASGSTAFSFQHGQSSTTDISTSEDELYARVEYVGNTMDKRDSFLTIVWILLAFGGRTSEALRSCYTAVTGVRAQVRTIWNAILHPGIHHYLVTTGDLVNMYARLAVAIQKENTYSEMNVIISEEVGKAEIARGTIRTRPLPPKITVPWTTKITTL
ncbi:MAG: hypothetical protein Q9182_005556 [Xanthomendoza sp. 2 TL-2023]